MATPTNQLDRYATYTYHFELYATNSVDSLNNIPSSGINDKTERDRPNGVLMLNTRKDAHQHVQNVEFEYISPGLVSGIAPFAALTMTVEEPGAAFFYEKIQRAMVNNQVTGIGSLLFGLKILFVGTTPQDEVEVYDKIPIIPLTLINFAANFTFRGGTYTLMFGNAGVNTVSNQTDPRAFSQYTHKALSVKANRLSEAFSKLQDTLNKNYNDWYENETNKPAGKKIKFEIVADPEIDGKFQTSSQESGAEGAKCFMSFDPKMPIIDMIKQLIHHCPEVNERIAASKNSFQQPLHENAFMYSIMPKMIQNDDNVVSQFRVQTYKGNKRGSGRGEYDFNFFFSGAGQNVDVMNFDMKMEQGLALFVGGTGSDDAAGNISGKLPTEFPKVWASDVVYEHKSQPRKQIKDDGERIQINDLQEHDIIPTPVSSPADQQAWNSQQVQNVNGAKQSYDSMLKLVGAAGVQKVLEIRGHVGILRECWAGTGPTENGFGITSGLWLKLNIYDENGRQFFYRDYYQVYAVKNIFQGGLFIQRLTLIMLPPTKGSSEIQSGTTSAQNQPGTNSNVKTSLPAAGNLRRALEDPIFANRANSPQTQKEREEYMRNWQENKDIAAAQETVDVTKYNTHGG